MLLLLRLAGLAGVGIIIATLIGDHHITTASWYIVVIAILLGIGLYSSTYGIDLKEARKYIRIILSAITIGVLLKALIIGGSLALFTRNPYYLILGVVVAQIDPLSVAALLHTGRLSSRAKSIIASWASFDDPITVIMALYAPLIIAQLTGADLLPFNGEVGTTGLIGYFRELGLNIAYAVGVLVLWLLIRRYFARSIHATAAMLSVALCFLLGTALSVAIYYFWMLAVAAMGLFLRPNIDKLITTATKWALWLATILLGMLLVGGVKIWLGLALAVAAFSSQIIVGFLLTHGLPRRDRVHIAFAQQNGITAIILSLLFEPVYPGTVAIVAPAIFFINAIHLVTNRLIDRRLG